MTDDLPAPGWYEDPEWPGWERQWDGAAWTNERRQSRQAVPPPPPSTPGRPRQSSNAGWALAMSILGLVCCILFSVPGFVMGRNELRDIDAGLVEPSNRGLALAAQIIGGIGMLLIVGFVAIILVVLVAGL